VFITQQKIHVLAGDSIKVGLAVSTRLQNVGQPDFWTNVDRMTDRELKTSEKAVFRVCEYAATWQEFDRFGPCGCDGCFKSPAFKWSEGFRLRIILSLGGVAASSAASEDEPESSCNTE
jgi:hypothetical protein